MRKINKNSSLGKGISIMKSVESMRENIQYQMTFDDNQQDINIQTLPEEESIKDQKYFDGSSFVVSNRVPSPYLRKTKD